MASIQSLQEQYEGLGKRFESRGQDGVDPSLLLAFDYDYPGQEAEVVIDTTEFTAVCPWTDLPDFGTLIVRYVPERQCIELKSFKYYLMSYAGVGVVQEHAVNEVLKDLVACCRPARMEVTLDYNVRGGLHATVTARYEKP